MPTIIFGGGKIDLTDRPNRELGKIANIPDTINTIPKYVLNGYKALSSDSVITQLPIAKIIPKTCVIEITNPPYIGSLLKNNLVEVDGTIVRVNDIRHSQQIDYEDTTNFSTSNTNPTVILSYDYGAVYNVNLLYIKLSINSYAALSIECSTDGSNYTNIGYYSMGASTIHIVTNVTFRYLRFRLWTLVSGYTATATIYKIVVIT
jgi:hypothetical protein